MRFVVSLFLCFYGLLPAYAYATPPQRNIYRAGTQDVPTAPSGFALKKIGQNLGDISALASINNDIFVLDRKRQRIIKLRDQNRDGMPDMKTVFLVGFERPSHMVADTDTLYISDAQGVWRIHAGAALHTDTMPTLIFPRTHTTALATTLAKLPIAVHPKTRSLYIADGQHIMRLDTQTLQVSIFAASRNDDLSVNALAVTPQGILWAALGDKNISDIIPLSPNTHFDIAQGADTKRTPIHAMVFWPDGLLIAQTGRNPMIAKRTFQYGSLAPLSEAFIQGFSRPSPLQGKLRIWGEPSAIMLMENGDFIFAERQTQKLWRVSKAAQTKGITVQVSEKDTKAQATDKIQRLENTSQKTSLVLHGSSIKSASSIKHGSLLKTSKELDTDKFSYRQTTQDEGAESSKKD
ncbi:MAG: hypothetical protein COA43_02365 [Robiginitomaculum sp.]|nr:MAG: hypothetical protein COA43_02365 [Robiginitomaculum sp.]